MLKASRGARGRWPGCFIGVSTVLRPGRQWSSHTDALIVVALASKALRGLAPEELLFEVNQKLERRYGGCFAPLMNIVQPTLGE